MTAMVHLDNALWPDKGSDADDQVKVRFADSAANDLSTMASAVQMLRAANSVSTEMAVQMLHPDWTKKQVAEEVERLKTPERLTMLNANVISPAEMRAFYMEEDTPQAEAAIAGMQQQKMAALGAAMPELIDNDNERTEEQS